MFCDAKLQNIYIYPNLQNIQVLDYHHFQMTGNKICHFIAMPVQHSVSNQICYYITQCLYRISTHDPNRFINKITSVTRNERNDFCLSTTYYVTTIQQEWTNHTAHTTNCPLHIHIHTDIRLTLISKKEWFIWMKLLEAAISYTCTNTHTISSCDSNCDNASYTAPSIHDCIISYLL